MHSRKHSKDTVNDVHAIKLCKTDLGTSPLYYGLSRRVTGGGEVVTGLSGWDLCRIFIFEMLENRANHQLYKVYFNGMFMIYLFIFWRKKIETYQ